MRRVVEYWLAVTIVYGLILLGLVKLSELLWVVLK